MKTYFDFCGVIFEIDSPKELWSHSEDFKTENKNTDVKIKLFNVKSLSEPRGKYLGRAGEKEVWQENNIIFRTTTDICRSEPHVQEQYVLDNIGQIDVYIKDSEWIWATREKYLWAGIALNQIMLHFNTLFFHASYIDVNGEGILFTAPSQTGKSTQANLWRKYRGAKIINGDKAAVRVSNVTTINSIPFSGTSGICKNVTVPLKAIVFLSQSLENTVVRMAPSQAISALCPNIFVDHLVSEEWSKALNIIMDLVSEVPVYSLACTPDMRAVEALEKELFR